MITNIYLREALKKASLIEAYDRMWENSDEFKSDCEISQLDMTIMADEIVYGNDNFMVFFNKGKEDQIVVRISC